MTPLQTRIVQALQAAPRQRMSYYDLAEHLWPHEQHPRAWRCSSNGGPPGLAMPFGKAIRLLRESGHVWQERAERGGQGPVRLLKGLP